MNADEILDRQITEMREELASANRTIGATFAIVEYAQSIAASSDGSHQVAAILMRAMNTLKRGDMGGRT